MNSRKWVITKITYSSPNQVKEVFYLEGNRWVNNLNDDVNVYSTPEQALTVVGGLSEKRGSIGVSQIKIVHNLHFFLNGKKFWYQHSNSPDTFVISKNRKHATKWDKDPTSSDAEEGYASKVRILREAFDLSEEDIGVDFELWGNN